VAKGCDNTDPLTLDNQLCFSVYSTAHAFTRLYRTLLDPLGLTYTQYIALLALFAEDGVSIKELGARLSLDSGTLTPVLRRLEKAGHVDRARDADDERIVRVTLTRSARAMRPELERVNATIAAATGLGPDELAHLQQQLRTLQNGLESGLLRLGEDPDARTG
jgi:DNA-binding MarR family transcriptional regulator